MGKFSRQQIDDIFLIFPRKRFDISCKLSAKETICMKCQRLFSGENKKLGDNLHEVSKPIFLEK